MGDFVFFWVMLFFGAKSRHLRHGARFGARRRDVGEISQRMKIFLR